MGSRKSEVYRTRYRYEWKNIFFKKNCSLLDFDDVLSATGGYGRWQVRNFFLLAAFPMAAGIAVVTWTFTAFQVE